MTPMMKKRSRRMFWIALIVLHLLAFGVLFRELTRGFYVKNRYNIQSISCSWILPTESGTSGCIEFRRDITPPKVKGLGIKLAMDLDYVSDSSKGTHKLLGHWRPGENGTKDSIIAITFLLREPNGELHPLPAGKLLRDVGMPCYRDATQDFSPAYPEQYHSEEDGSSITDLAQFRRNLNSGSPMPFHDDGKVAFFLWPDSLLTDLLVGGRTLGMTLTTHSGREISTWLPPD
jgi:hypothetical protein